MSKRHVLMVLTDLGMIGIGLFLGLLLSAPPTDFGKSCQGRVEWETIYDG